MSKKNITPIEKSVATTIKRYGRDYYAEIGSLGGQATVKRYGRKFMGLVGTLANENLSKTRRTLVTREINRRVANA